MCFLLGISFTCVGSEMNDIHSCSHMFHMHIIKLTHTGTLTWCTRTHIAHSHIQALLGSSALIGWLQDKKWLLSLYSAFIPGMPAVFV